jgi:hypothetical protein|tara:strand:+ start:27 stop:317 length:291 start_codon:yes stop_codon:yes gene_type:complete
MQKRSKINRKNIAKHLMRYQLNLVAKDLDNALDDNWAQWTLTVEQYEQFRQYSIKTLKKVFKFNTTKAKDTFSWFYRHFGLIIYDKNNSTKTETDE